MNYALRQQRDGIFTSRVIEKQNTIFIFFSWTYVKVRKSSFLLQAAKSPYGEIFGGNSFHREQIERWQVIIFITSHWRSKHDKETP